MKNVEKMLRQAHDVLYDELNRNVREMTTKESNFIRDCLDDMDTWIQNAERKFGRADASQSRKSVKSSVENAIRELSEYFQRTPDGDTIYPRHKITRADEIEIDNICYENDVDFAMDEYSVTVYPKDEDDNIYSGCHGKSDKRRREKKEDELESSRRFVKSDKAADLYAGFGKFEPIINYIDSDDLLSDLSSLDTFEVQRDRDRGYVIYNDGEYVTTVYSIDELENLVRKMIRSSHNTRFSKFDHISSRRDINPSLAYNEGWDAYKDGADVDDNPYDKTSDEYIEWEEGWNLAYVKDPYSGAYVPNSRNVRTLSKFNRISSLFIKNDFFAEGEECIVEIKEDGKWKMVSLDNTPEGWSTKKKAKVFKSEKDARKSALIGRLNDAGYSEEAGNLRFSVN